MCLDGAEAGLETLQEMERERRAASKLVQLTEVPEIGIPIGKPTLVRCLGGDAKSLQTEYGKQELGLIMPRGANAYVLGNEVVPGLQFSRPIQFYLIPEKDAP